MKISKIDGNKKNYITKKRYIYFPLIIILFYFIFIIDKGLISKNKSKYSIYKSNKTNFEIKNLNNKEYVKKGSILKIHSNTYCYTSPDNSDMKILHFIITRFLIDFISVNGFPKRMYKDKYILNGIRVMKKYLFPSLENQRCKNFTWILILGNKANITFVKSLLTFQNTFHKEIIYKKDLKNYLRNRRKGIDVLITTRIDYDDRIYYDAVNDVRKAINIQKPMIIYGYNRGMYFFEENDKYYNFDLNYNNQGVMSIFISLITVLNKVNDTYTIYDMGNHVFIRKYIMERYKSFGIKELNYEPTNFDSGAPKFVWVRQKYSGTYDMSSKIQKVQKETNFSLFKFYGK